jgi:hypothetical protein
MNQTDKPLSEWMVKDLMEAQMVNDPSPKERQRLLEYERELARRGWLPPGSRSRWSDEIYGTGKL